MPFPHDHEWNNGERGLDHLPPDSSYKSIPQNSIPFTTMGSPVTNWNNVWDAAGLILVVAGVVCIATGVGAPAGASLIATGASLIITTKNVTEYAMINEPSPYM